MAKADRCRIVITTPRSSRHHSVDGDVHDGIVQAREMSRFSKHSRHAQVAVDCTNSDGHRRTFTVAACDDGVCERWTAPYPPIPGQK